VTGSSRPSTHDEEAAVERFEAAVLAQQPRGAEHYDEDYFSAPWRRDGSRYDLGCRRRLEGIHPRLIKEVFRPGRVLDMGCGPGMLMLLLLELGLDVTGIDFSQASRRLAPDAVREKIVCGDLTDRIVEPRSFDLVICREVLEHLSVLQVRRALERACEASSRFVYLTTRFHPAPVDLLDFTTDLETDPTHITVLSKGLVRSLLVLEGFGRRADLEDAMDWAGKGRVLVYERRVT
jgi:SAM-dependent methyltransferase